MLWHFSDGISKKVNRTIFAFLSSFKKGGVFEKMLTPAKNHMTCSDFFIFCKFKDCYTNNYQHRSLEIR